MKKINNEINIIIRSTVPPGTCDKLECNFMPEFLTELNWKDDFYNTKHWIFGLYDKNNDRLIHND